MRTDRNLFVMLVFILIALIISCSSTGEIKKDDLSKYSKNQTFEDGMKHCREAIYNEYKAENKIEAINCYLKAKTVFEHISHQERDKYLAGCLHQLAGLYDDIGQYTNAIKYGNQAVILHERIGNKADLSGALSNLGTIYQSIGNQKKAVECLSRALALDRQLKDLSHSCVVYFNLASVYLEIKQYQKAESYYQKIIEIMTGNPQLQEKSLVSRISVQAGLFQSYLFAGNFSEAREYLNLLNDPIHRPFYSGLFALHEQNFEKAISELSAALSGSFRPYRPEFKSKGLSMSLKFKPQKEPMRKYINTLEDSIACKIALGNAYEGNGDRDKALMYYKEVMEKTEAQRDLLSADQRTSFYSKRITGFSIIDAYEGAARIACEKGNYAEGYLYSEQISARLFSEEYARRVRDTDVPVGEIAPDIQEKEKRLNTLIEEIKKRQLAKDTADKDFVDGWYERQKKKSIGTILTWALIKGVTNIKDAAVDSLADRKLESLIEERDKLMEEIRSGKAGNRKYAATHYPEPVKLTDITMDADETIVKFEVTDTGVIRWTIKDKAITSCTVLPVPRKKLENMISDYRKYFENVRTTEDLNKFDKQLSHKLFLTLFDENILTPGQRLIIIADETLATLPFATLITSRDQPTYYLGDLCVPTYFQSVSALHLYRELADTSTSSSGLLVVADPLYSTYPPKNDELPTLSLQLMRVVKEAQEPVFISLPKTRAMAECICANYSGTSEKLLGEKASESELKNQNLSQFKYIIFAAHGILKGQLDIIDEPSLILTRTGNTQESDGFLTAGEVLGFDLNADLVSLTACHTAQGESLPGEGVMGLFRSFQHAGARNVVATLWAVSEDASAEFNELLFNRLGNGEKLLSAFHKSIEDIRQNGYDNPFYWGAFSLIGI